MDSIPKRKAVFILSLDLELLWGLINTRSYHSIHLLNRVGGTKLRKYIFFIINVLEKYRVPATWAVVGSLFLDCTQKQDKFVLDKFNLLKLHSPKFITESGHKKLYFGKDILDIILSSKVSHEIGYHSFSHTIFSQISKEMADLEIKTGIEMAKQLGINFKSFVFPQNKVGHIDVLRKHGFSIYRGRTLRYNNFQTPPLHKVDGLFNEIIAQPVVPEWKNGIWEIPSSMQFCDTKYPFSLLPRTKLGLWRAIRYNKIFHIWLHPWNLLEYDSMPRDFEQIIKYVHRKKIKGKINIMTMGDFATYLNKINYSGTTV